MHEISYKLENKAFNYILSQNSYFEKRKKRITNIRVVNVEFVKGIPQIWTGTIYNSAGGAPLSEAGYDPHEKFT